MVCCTAEVAALTAAWAVALDDGNAGVTRAGGVDACLEISCSSRRVLCLAACMFSTESRIDKPTKNVAEYLVILVSAFPEPGPNRASVAAPPKAMPAPASFLGS